MKQFLMVACSCLFLASCGGNNSGRSLTDIDASENFNTRVNGITQSLPSIMVIPADQTLVNSQCLKTTQSNGKTYYTRDYNGFMMRNNDAKRMIQAIQNQFAKMGYPLTDLEQSLKSLENQAAMDEADLVAKDAKTMLVATCSPDIIIELNMTQSMKQISRTQNQKVLEYSLSGIDAFNNKAVAAFTQSNTAMNLNEYLAREFADDLPRFTDQIAAYFKDIIVNGREITFRVTLDATSAINLTDDYNDMGDTYADWIRNWVKTHAKNGTATMQRNTAKEIFFSSVRITNHAADGTQFNAYDFANQFRKAFLATFQIKNTNATQGLGDAYVIIK